MIGTALARSSKSTLMTLLKKLLFLLIWSSAFTCFADDLSSFISARTKSPGGRLSISLDGKRDGWAPGEHGPIHLARLFDHKAGNFVGRKLSLTTKSGPLAVENRIEGSGGWGAIWHPDSKFVVLAAPVSAGSILVEYFYFQVSDSGILPMSLPDLESHAVRAFNSHREVSVTAVEPREWTSRNRLLVAIEGTCSIGNETPDFHAQALLTFAEDGNVTVDAFFDLGTN